MDYSNCVIYKLIGECGGVYIGHTINIKNRMWHHKAPSNPNSSNVLTIKTHIVLENYPCANFEEARIREQYWMDKEPIIINARRAVGLPPTEASRRWRENNPIRYVEQNKVKWAKNREKRMRKVTCVCGDTLQSSNLKRHQRTKGCLEVELLK